MISCIAARLVAVGVGDIDGFALNVSNFQFTANTIQYGTWIADCVAYATSVDPGNFNACPHQYGWNGDAPLSPYGEWSDAASDAALNTAHENQGYAQLLGTTQPAVHFVVDTSRNGRGPWRGTRRHPASDANTEAWCNPLGRGAGARPTANTGLALVDAFLWIKTPGWTDGACYRWTDGPRDPVWPRHDPDAGWFGAMARQLADNAVPSLLP